MADYWVHVAESITPAEFASDSTTDEYGNTTYAGLTPDQLNDPNAAFFGTANPIVVTNPTTGQSVSLSGDGNTLFGKAIEVIPTQEKETTGVGFERQLNDIYTAYYLNGAIDQTLVTNTPPVSTDQEKQFAIGQITVTSDSSAFNYHDDESHDGGYLVYNSGFWVDLGSTSSSLTVDPESKSESQIVQLSAVNSLTGSPNASAGTISYTDTDQTATVAGVLGTQTVTATDQSGNSIALTDSQQAQLEAEFSLVL